MKIQHIEFKKKRELGDILSDTFAFLRIQFKPFFTTFFKIVGPYLAVFLISYGFYFSSFSSLLDFNANANFNSNPLNAFSSINFILAVIALLFSGIATYVLSQATTLYYIQSYAENNGVINETEIRKNVYKNFWSFIGLGILVFLSVGIALIFCCIPGIFLYVPLSLSFAIMVYSKRSATDSFGYSFDLVKEHWWMTFATIFVVGLIVTFASYAFSIPAVIYQYFKLGIFSGEMDAENMDVNFVDPIYIVLNLISTLAQFLFNIISLVAIAFIYFNLNEIKNNEGTMERIQKLGGDLDS
ncbi:hypothetical protein I2486_14005 [Cellulophaga sp. E16_2]|uniref:hypothetical protein n=1 Tax=Cellulophaga sp. E16_2 TaxID=2789297 RepID=UPI001A910843|nr:hypothetical protein [Cellulophaga sp. E16_2]MBO0592516.1 hypothetical protein [Cellulophaga sp. E16_2]